VNLILGGGKYQRRINYDLATQIECLQSTDMAYGYTHLCLVTAVAVGTRYKKARWKCDNSNPTNALPPPTSLPCNQPTSFASIPNVIPVNALAASTLIVLFSENLLEFSNFVFLNLSKIL
jgi:hypothetical protein